MGGKKSETPDPLLPLLLVSPGPKPPPLLSWPNKGETFEILSATTAKPEEDFLRPEKRNPPPFSGEAPSDPFLFCSTAVSFVLSLLLSTLDTECSIPRKFRRRRGNFSGCLLRLRLASLCCDLFVFTSSFLRTSIPPRFSPLLQFLFTSLRDLQRSFFFSPKERELFHYVFPMRCNSNYPNKSFFCIMYCGNICLWQWQNLQKWAEKTC